MRFIIKDFFELYFIYIYRYFIYNWLKLCFLVRYEKMINRFNVQCWLKISLFENVKVVIQIRFGGQKDVFQRIRVNYLYGSKFKIFLYFNMYEYIGYLFKLFFGLNGMKKFQYFFNIIMYQ